MFINYVAININQYRNLRVLRLCYVQQLPVTLESGSSCWSVYSGRHEPSWCVCRGATTCRSSLDPTVLVRSPNTARESNNMQPYQLTKVHRVHLIFFFFKFNVIFFYEFLILVCLYSNYEYYIVTFNKKKFLSFYIIVK